MKILILLLLGLTFVLCELPKDTRIVIIGAGGAGMAALSRLIEHGYTEVTLLEAENRIGGRINTVEFGLSMIDHGAQWCHDQKGNLIYDMLEESKMLDYLGKDPPSLYSGDQISSEREEKSDYNDLLAISDGIFRHNEDCKNFPSRPYGEYFIEA